MTSGFLKLAACKLQELAEYQFLAVLQGEKEKNTKTKF
jgi:hypothetical protein